MHDIISAFERRTGGGVILNTSFNLHGFPDRPHRRTEALAVSARLGTGIFAGRRLFGFKQARRRD